jgi:hypothetical protein
MLGSGDATMERMALRAGLTSTSGVARGVALEAFMNSQPTLMAFAEIDGEDQEEVFARWIAAVGSLSSSTTGNFPIGIGPYSAEDNCFVASDRPTTCSSRLGGTEVSFYSGGSWGTARLNESCELVGSISHNFNSSMTTGPITLTIPLLGQLQ